MTSKNKIYIITRREIGGDHQSDTYPRAFKTVDEAVKAMSQWSLRIDHEYEKELGYTTEIVDWTKFQEIDIVDTDDPDHPTLEELTVEELDI